MQDSFIINSRIDNVSSYNMRFVFLHLLNGALMLFQIINRCKPLDLLGIQVTIRHGVPDRNNLQSPGHQKLYHPSGCLALAAARTDGTDGNNRFPALYHGSCRAKQNKVGSGCIHYRTD